MNPIDFRNVIAETPYDAMGAEFQETFGKWVNETELESAGSLNPLAYGLFRLRLDLAKKYKTYFSSQVTANGTRELWKERYLGQGNSPCYSFASKNVPRTRRFWVWSKQIFVDHRYQSSERHWDTDYAPFPELPVTPTRLDPMLVWATTYEPRFTARTGGSFQCRIILYGKENGIPLFLFEHPRSRWIAQIRAEATTFWNIAFDHNNEQFVRFAALASWEWLWAWSNPFMRSGALTMDALSLVMQRHIGVNTRTFYYHQDAEALLTPFDHYVEKRIEDMSNGFKPKFDMNVA